MDYNNDTSINDLDDVETINYNDTNVSEVDNINLKKTSGAQITAKKIQGFRKKKTVPKTTDLANLETIGYNNDTSISDLNDIATGSKKGAHIAA